MGERWKRAGEKLRERGEVSAKYAEVEMTAEKDIWIDKRETAEYNIWKGGGGAGERASTGKRM